MIINFKFRIFFIFFHKSIFALEFTSTGSILFVLWYVLLYLLTITLNLWSYLMLRYMSYLILKSFNSKYYFSRCFSNNKFSFIMFWIHFYINILKPWLHWSFVKSILFKYPYFIWFTASSSNIFWKSLVTIIPFFPVKRTTHACLL